MTNRKKDLIKKLRNFNTPEANNFAELLEMTNISPERARTANELIANNGHFS
jgi:hypothetical protein